MIHYFMQKILLFHAFKTKLLTKYIDFELVPKKFIYIEQNKKLT